MNYFLAIFGCAANTADAERIAFVYEQKGYTKVASWKEADEVVIVTCMIRQTAEDRVTGLIRNLTLHRKQKKNLKIIVTGCMVGVAKKDPSGLYEKMLQKRFPSVDTFLPIEQFGYDIPQLRFEKHHALIPISNGCNNYCSYCIVPFSRGREVSRSFESIMKDCSDAIARGNTAITLVGQNVNSYGADILNDPTKNHKTYMFEGNELHPVMVNHLGKFRIMTLFPHLLRAIALLPGITALDFISSNPWDFSDELIDVIATYPIISRAIHLPIQSGDATVLRKMNRWYTPTAYIRLITRMKKKIIGVTFSTDIIVGFPGETEKQFQHTVDIVKRVGFTKAYISQYSDRPKTLAHTSMKETITSKEKKRRWEILDDMINKTNLKNGTYR